MPKDAIAPEVSWAHTEAVRAEVVDVAQVTQELRTRPDGTQLTFTVVQDVTTSTYFYDLSWDPRFTEFGIATEPNGLLINQAQTRDMWAKKMGKSSEEVIVGKDPQVYMLAQDDPITTRAGSVGFPATNTFWQYGGFFIKNRELVHLPDDHTLTGVFETLVLTESGWQEADLKVIDGQPDTSLHSFRLGLSMPMILRNGVAVPQIEIVARGDPRALADMRNFMNFADGRETAEGFDNAFFDMMRLIQPGTPGGAKIVAMGKELITDSHEVGMVVLLPKNKADRLSEIVEKVGLTNHFGVIHLDDEQSLIQISGPFPNNRAPITVIGHNNKGKLVAGFFNGRQVESTGATFDEAASILKEYGAVNAGIGACGGDTAVLHKVFNQKFETLNKPSNKGGVTRPAPNFLTIQGTDPLLRYS